MYNGKQVIAEIKTQSPSGFNSPYSWDELFKLANSNPYVDVISIHTNPKWGGSFDLIRKAKSLTRKPILAKGIHETDEEVQKAIEAGADFVLVVGRVPKVHKDKCFLEPYLIDEIKDYPAHSTVVWNSRDLKALPNEKFKKETIRDVRVVWKGRLIQASNLKTKDDMHTRADAVLVGSNLPEFLASLE
jgi:indole-3-glycerol phosphate synthase